MYFVIAWFKTLFRILWGKKESFGFNDYGLLYGYELPYAVKKQNNII